MTCCGKKETNSKDFDTASGPERRCCCSRLLFVIFTPCAFNRGEGHWLNYSFWCHCVSNLIKIDRGRWTMLTRLECTETISCKKKVTKSWWRRIPPKWNGIIRWVIIFRETKHENRSRNFNKKIIFFLSSWANKKKQKTKRERNLTWWNKLWTCTTPLCPGITNLDEDETEKEPIRKDNQWRMQHALISY